VNLGYRIRLFFFKVQLWFRRFMFQRYLNTRKDKLAQADLSYLDLSRLNLSRANLRGANLRRANLTRTNLREARLEGANLTLSGSEWRSPVGGRCDPRPALRGQVAPGGHYARWPDTRIASRHSDSGVSSSLATSTDDELSRSVSRGTCWLQ
jgi:hypothetical protein